MAEAGSEDNDSSLAVAIIGSGGCGAVTAGQILLLAVSRTGYYGLMTRSAGPQIRGGESAAMVRFSMHPITCMGDSFDIALGLDWRNINRFMNEIPLDEQSLVLYDPVFGEVPECLAGSGARLRDVCFKNHADAVEGGRVNMAAIGVLGAVAGLPLESLEFAVRAALERKGREVVEAAMACMNSAYKANVSGDIPALAHAQTPQRWNISGNEASGLGALRGGVRFVAAYPITPASEMLEWLAPRLESLGGSLLQAEDELASVNMIIGASFGGVPAFTATSGPGLSLMMEGLGLAVASETPIVVADVMRGGPSTGIPTKSEQSDLNIALYGCHGDAPHLVLAPLDIRDCVFTTQWAVCLAEYLQTAAIVLTDQSLGQSRAVVDPPQVFEPALQRVRAKTPGDGYLRYELTGDGISPMAIPGEPCAMYTGDGLEHDSKGAPSSLPGDHRRQLDKRLHKLENFDYSLHWADIRGSGELCLITWGSVSGAVFEAAQHLNKQQRPTRVVALRLLYPLQRDALRTAWGGACELLVVEQNQGGQLFHYLHSQQALPAHARSYARPGPAAMRPAEIIAAIGQEV